MKAVILAGGLGTRISEESVVRPKPMVEIGGLPILLHIMKIYSYYGVTEFIICCGYKGYVIKEYFNNYFLHSSDVTFDFSTNETVFHVKRAEPWKVTLVDTGDNVQTGGRLARIQRYLGTEPFCMTYGDGVASIDVKATIKFHLESKKEATMSVVSPPGRFGAVALSDSLVSEFVEKPLGDGARINGGFFVLDPSVLRYVDGDDCVWEQGPLSELARQGQLAAYKHDGFWQPMDTLRDKQYLERLWVEGIAPWRVW